MSNTFQCPNCGAPLDTPRDQSATTRCQFCNTSVIVPPELRSQAGRIVAAVSDDSPDSMEDMVESISDITRLAQSGSQEEAVRLFRDEFGVGQTDAEQAVEGIWNAGLPASHDLSAIPGSSRTARKNTTMVSGKVFSQYARKTAKIGGCFFTFILLIAVVVPIAAVLAAMASNGGPLQETWLKINPFAGDPITLAFGEEGEGPGLLKNPRAIAVDAQGNIFVADYTTGRIQRFDSEGKYLSQINVGKEIISDLDIGPDGMLYAVYKRDIYHFAADSGMALGVLPKADSRLNYTDLAVTADGGMVIVNNGEDLLRFDPAGNMLWAVEKAVTNVVGETERECRAAVDGLGNIFIAGNDQNSVFVFSPEGKYQTRIGSEGDEKGQFNNLHTVVVDEHSRVYVSTPKGIHVFEKDGRYIRTIKVKGSPFGLAVDNQGGLYTATSATRIYRYQVKE